MGIKTYNPKNVTITLVSGLGAHIVKGYDDGQFINIEYESDAYDHIAGADGEEMRVKKNDRRASCTITLLQSSDTNNYLSNLENLDRVSDSGVAAFLLKDASSGEIVATDSVWIKKRPAYSRDKSKVAMAWVLSMKSPDFNYAGAAES
jgi:hypothetical protein